MDSVYYTDYNRQSIVRTGPYGQPLRVKTNGQFVMAMCIIGVIVAVVIVSVVAISLLMA